MFENSYSKHTSFLTVFLFNLLITALGLCLTLPVQAYENDYMQNNSLDAGIYLHIPFGPAKKNTARLNYGLRFSLNREFTNNYRNNMFQLNNRQLFTADLLSVNFSENGFRGLAFAGQETFIMQNGVLKATDEGKRSTGALIFTIGAALGLGIIIYTVIDTSSNNVRR